ncbi:hypothetical protein A374_03709 [Fictibacillus macauensis ZFHKF-1]|uniref:UPF0398 protein A374_03709 n=1 Tax=Fictibacillus macauensis ZFHKF-1 TaxID=1196324 RepID=I8J4E6_9BACL|nr:DUF1273 domain-containing protein [Fictibacillus macauensis]EIT86646.1 hypothetical protein A374_03709 [Fictibacillus macauensis ZFHKF-1]
MKNVLVTGYKAHELGIYNEKHEGIYYIKKALERRLQQLIEEEGLEWVIISGQSGVEMWAGEVTVHLRENYPHVRLAILTPFQDQQSKWKEERQAQYEELLRQADFVESLSHKPYESPGQLRSKNRFLVQKTDGIVALYDEDKPGSPRFYLENAKLRQENDASYEILYITPYDLEILYEEEQAMRGDFFDQ